MYKTLYPLTSQRLILGPDTLAAVFETEISTARLDEEIHQSQYSEPLQKILLNIEALSTMGLENRKVPVSAYFWAISQKEASGCALNLERDIPPYLKRGLDDEDAMVIQGALNHSHALFWIKEKVSPERSISSDDLLTVMQIITSGNSSRTFDLGHMFEQNDIRQNASYDLMFDLCEFSSSAKYSPLIQASLAHLQIELFKPFGEYTDQVGLALSHMINIHRGLTRHKTIIPFTWAGFMKSSLREKVKDTTNPKAIEQWVMFNSRTTEAALTITRVFHESIKTLNTEWRDRLGITSYTDSALNRLLIHLLASPAVSIKSASQAINKSLSATKDALNKLRDNGIVHAFNVNNKERIFVAREAIDCIVDISTKLSL